MLPKDSRTVDILLPLLEGFCITGRYMDRDSAGFARELARLIRATP